jgi:hypothetical protein
MNRIHVIGVRNKPTVASGQGLVGIPTGTRHALARLLEMSSF